MQKGSQLMAEELFIPQLGQTVESVTIINWHVKDGDRVEQGQEVLEVETDKAVFDVEATDDGFIHVGPFKVGDVVPVLTVVAVIGEADDQFEVKQPANEVPEDTPLEKAPASSISTRVMDAKPAPTDSEKVFASPRARKLAAEKHVDLAEVRPSGGGGMRVRVQDVEAYLARDVKVSPIARRMAEEAGLDLRSLPASGARGEIKSCPYQCRSFTTINPDA
jgi:pyruvate dehydrogenase E2 component (dihydrolipoamide acetyltransferase)